MTSTACAAVIEDRSLSNTVDTDRAVEIYLEMVPSAKNLLQTVGSADWDRTPCSDRIALLETLSRRIRVEERIVPDVLLQLLR